MNENETRLWRTTWEEWGLNEAVLTNRSMWTATVFKTQLKTSAVKFE